MENSNGFIPVNELLLNGNEKNICVNVLIPAGYLQKDFLGGNLNRRRTEQPEENTELQYLVE